MIKIVELPIEEIASAPWNPNEMDQTMLGRLRQSIKRFGLVVPLVVRPIGSLYETIGGAQRLSVLRDLGIDSVPCVMVETDDANARLLAQALNRIQGEDDLGLKAELLREVLEQVPQEEVLSMLPETASSLTALASLGQGDIASYIQNWQQAQSSRLKHLTFQFTSDQLEVIETALAQVMPESGAVDSGNPNSRGNALFLICQSYLDLIGRSS